MQNQCSWFFQRFLIIGQPDLVGGAYFDKFCPGLFHNIRDAELAADFYQLCAGDDNPLPPCEGGQYQQHGSGIVIYNNCRLCIGQTLK